MVLLPPVSGPSHPSSIKPFCTASSTNWESSRCSHKLEPLSAKFPAQIHPLAGQPAWKRDELPQIQRHLHCFTGLLSHLAFLSQRRKSSDLHIDSRCLTRCPPANGISLHRMVHARWKWRLQPLMQPYRAVIQSSSRIVQQPNTQEASLGVAPVRPFRPLYARHMGS